MDIQKLINEYAAWLKSEITFEKIGEYYEITTPYLDNANDYLQIYVRQSGDDIFFTDDSATIQGLKMSGFQFTPNRKAHLQRILNQYGIKLEGDELVAKAPINGFAQKKHLFIQAIMRIDDMFAISKSKVASFFLDDIQDFFEAREIYYSDNVQFTGISGFAHNYDFLLQRTKNKPERLCQAVNNPNKSSMGNILFAWNDTKPSRKKDSQLIVILNDQNNVARGVEDAFANYDAKVIRWSERDKVGNLSLISA
ncbi:MAG: DUF1829 domain-containing protein [Oscillospiraceae bacterium]|nr:DUF1829 domain-containing protein [Oscillospiraceae bacterium]